MSQEEDRLASLVDIKSIMSLTDLELAKALYFFSQSEMSATLLKSDWERSFAKGIEETVVKGWKLSYKQRKFAREIIVRFTAPVIRRRKIRGE